MASDIQDDGQQNHAAAHNGSAAVARNGKAANLASIAAHLTSGDDEEGPLSILSPRAERTPLFPDSEPSDDGSGSELVTSPSVTSPPYWSAQAAGTHGHQRVLSNMSAESVLPPGAITLQDNEHDDGPDGDNVYGRDRNRACWARSVQVRDYVLVNGSTTNIGAFVVWNIKVETLNVRPPLPLATARL
jgi:hypothetical protein